MLLFILRFRVFCVHQTSNINTKTPTFTLLNLRAGMDPHPPLRTCPLQGFFYAFPKDSTLHTCADYLVGKQRAFVPCNRVDTGPCSPPDRTDPPHRTYGTVLFYSISSYPSRYIVLVVKLGINIIMNYR